MKISIITPIFNSSKTIERTINSVINQIGVDLEYIIIDGASTDDTLKIIDRHKDRISKVISEKDRGIYDAMNKGIGLAAGDIIGILNSDDYYDDNLVLSKIVKSFEDINCEAVYGDLVYFNEGEQDKIVRYWRAKKFNIKKINFGWIPPHPTFFVAKKIYDKIGGYRLDLPIAADFEFMLRCFKKYNIKPVYLPIILTRMQSGGASAYNLKSRLNGFNQLIKAWKINGFKVPLTFYLRPFFKAHQYFARFYRNV